MKFPCTQCGQCCKNIQGIDLLKSYHSGDGVCYFYEKTEGCLIYEFRPDVCNIEKGYERFFSQYLSLDEYLKNNALACNALQEKECMDESYRVVIE